MFCEFPRHCLNCGAALVISIPVPDSTRSLPDGSFFKCECLKCGASRSGSVPKFDPRSLVAVRSSDSVEGRLT